MKKYQQCNACSEKRKYQQQLGIGNVCNESSKALIVMKRRYEKYENKPEESLKRPSEREGGLAVATIPMKISMPAQT